MKSLDAMDPARDGDAARRNSEAASRLSHITGEFRSHVREKAFAASRLGEMVRHGRWLLIASALLNTLFYASDWRFVGTGHFWVAIAARSAIVIMSLACLVALPRCQAPGQLKGLFAAWVAVTVIGVAVLVSSRSDLALFVVLLLPMIVYLGVPLPFAWLAIAGIGASALLLAGYEVHAQHHEAAPGLVLALLTLNCCLLLVVSRSNRLQRLEWQATRAACAFADELAASRETLRQLFAAAPIPMVVTSRDEGVILQVNDAGAAMFGITDAMIGKASFEPLYADPAQRDRLLRRLDRDGHVNDFEIEAWCVDGKRRPVMIKASAIDLASGRAMILSIIDISERRAVERNLEMLASTDPLTRLPNRLSFFATARAEMMRSTRSGRPLALLMIDLDHFKAVNDTFGHLAGDCALRAFSQLCLDRLRGNGGHAGRLGGEEFGILLPDADIATAHALAEDICAGLSALRLPEPHHALRLSASIGLTAFRANDKDFDATLARADGALYAAKRGGRARVHIDADDTAQPLRKAAG